MSKYIKNILTLIGAIIIASFLVFLYNCIISLASFSAQVNPALEPWVFWTLFASVTAGLAWVVISMLMRPRPLLIYASPSEHDLAKFRQQLLKRLKKNKHLKDANIKVENEKDLEPALAALENKANEEIRTTAKRVFIGSAVAQNGRLDTLVVLALVIRLAWRISKLYNQRPHPREMMNLYANIAVTSFIAGSVEDLGIDDYVGELMAPLLSGSAIGAVPGAQAIASTITSSVLTGSTNCLLALRCGIVARNYMSLKLDESGSMRRNATVEASGIFVTMSGETVTFVTKQLVKGASNAMKKSTGKVTQSVGTAVSGAAESVSSGTRNAGKSVKQGAESIMSGMSDGVSRMASTTRQTAEIVSEAGKASAKNIGNASRTSARKISETMGKMKESTTDGASKIAHTTKTASSKTLGTITTAKESVRKFTGELANQKKAVARNGKAKINAIAKILKRVE